MRKETSLTLLLALSLALPSPAQHSVRRGGSVLAYGLRYDPERVTDDMPAALRSLLLAYKTQTRYADRTEGAAVEPLVNSHHGQYEPYNNSCPYYTYDDGTQSEERCLTGCAATCIEQVLTYWRHPEALTDTLRGWETEHYTIDDIPAGTVIDWDNILDDYSGGYTDEQAKAVADLAYYCGVAAQTIWGLDGSSAEFEWAIESLRNAFGYKTVAFACRVYYSNDTWNSLLRNELENGRPICYGGYDMTLVGHPFGVDNGHGFIIDGVDEEGYYHVNWGWSGLYDGYYDLDYMNPYEPYGDTTELGRNIGFFSGQETLFLCPDSVDIGISDTLSSADILYGVSVDTVTFRRQPETQGYVVADCALTNTTGEELNFTFWALTFPPTDTAHTYVDYVAASSVCLSPGESKVWPIYCQFSESGERAFAITTDDETLLYQLPVSVAEGVDPELSFGDISYELTAYGDSLAVTFAIDVSNEARGGTAGDLISYYLFGFEPHDGMYYYTTVAAYWDVLSLPAGETQRLSVTFRNLTEGYRYELDVYDSFLNVVGICEFLASAGEASDGVNGLEETLGDDGDVWFDLSGRRVERPVRGVYIKRGKKVLVR